MLSDDIILRVRVPDVLFSDDEKKEIIERWNNSLGAETASHIFRKRNFEHGGVEVDEDGKERYKEIRNERDYRSLKQMEYFQTLKLIKCVEGMEGAEWKNYMGTSCSKNKVGRSFNSGWIKIPARCEAMFGEPYLKEKDWRIGQDIEAAPSPRDGRELRYGKEEHEAEAGTQVVLHA